jgi:hypothetical protein
MVKDRNLKQVMVRGGYEGGGGGGEGMKRVKDGECGQSIFYTCMNMEH